MKKLDLKLGSIKELLSKEQMKKVVGGYYTTACNCMKNGVLIGYEEEDCDAIPTCDDQCVSFCQGLQ